MFDSKREDEFEIESPCEADAAAMEDREHGWFCHLCDKNVYDASRMTRAQFTKLMDRMGEDVCISLTYDENDELVFASPEQRRWLQQLAGLGKLIATASIPPLLLAGCLESQPPVDTQANAQAPVSMPAPVTSSTSSPTAIEQKLREQEEIAASRLAKFHIEAKQEQDDRPVHLDDALSELNEMQRRRNARHGHPEHPSEEVIEQPLAPGEKMVVDVDKHDILKELEVIQLERQRSRVHRGRMIRRPKKITPPVINFTRDY